MCNPTIVLDKIVEKIVGIAFESVGRHLGYLFHYKKNIKNLDVEMKKLQEQRGTIERKIDEAETRGEVIVDDVSDWRKEVNILRQGVETFMDQKTVKENVQCFKYSCPDFISRYRLSKEAEKKMCDVKCLTQKANFDTISRPAPPPLELQFPSSGEYVSFDSRAPAFNMIMEALKDSKVNVIGVYGAGGVGKTTMVEKVGEQVKKDGLFDEVVMAVVSQDAKVGKIQGLLADCLNNLKLEGETEVGRAKTLWNRLNNGKRNLVILDDIWKELNLKEIGIPITDGNKGCKVVLTSRNQRVLENMRVDKDFPIQVLSEQEAWNLFKKKMGNYVDSHGQLHDIAYAICNECRGLPVAILAVGAALKGKSMPAWRSSLDKLKKCMLNKIDDIDPKLFTSLRLSYDYLESTDAKSCFLLCCLFPEDAQVPIEELARHCMARRLLDQNLDTLEETRDAVCSVVNTLKTSCLLLDGKNDDFVKMHDIVRDVAISIAKKEKAFLVKHGVKEWPETGTYEKYSAISLRSESIHELPDELVCPELHTLILECSGSKFQPELYKEISDGFFRGTQKLVVLELNKVTLLPLSSSLGKLTELRMLCLIDCKLGDIAILKYLRNKLEVLRLRGSDIKALPTEVGELTHLRLLDLGDCDELKVIPSGVISKLYRLEELHFPHGFWDWEGTTGNEEIGKVILDELMSLTRLSTLAINIPHQRLLPKDLGFQNLIRFNITVCPEFGSGIEGTSVVLLKLLDDDFNILERLLGKPGRGGLYPSRSFNNLTQLVLTDCRLKYLFSPSCARGLLQLQSLQLWGSEIMEAVIGNEGEKDEEIIANVIKFSQLKTLILAGLPLLISFYPQIKKATTTESHSFPPPQSLFNEKVAFPALEKLSIYLIPNITEIWDKNLLSAESFCQLRSLKIRDCEKLMNVVPSHMLSQLKSIETLKVSKCPEMEVIVVLEKREEETQEATNKDMIIVFSQLRDMTLQGLENLKGVCAFKSENQLCFNVQNIQTLKVSNCPKMEVIVVLEKREEETQEAANKDIIIVFPKLRSLELRELENLKGVCAYKSEDRLCFNVQVALPALEGLFISSVPNITEIWDKNFLQPESNCLPRSLGIRGCEKLRFLKVKGCEKLMNVVPSHMLPQLKSIEALKVSKCPEMEAIIVLEKREAETQKATNKDIIVFPELRILMLRELENLKSVCAYKSKDRLCFNVQVAFPSLEELSIDELPNITKIWDKNLLQLESFCLLRSSGVRGYEKLRSLEVEDCKKLMNVVPSHMLPLLKNIQFLNVSNCPEMEVIVVLEKREEETQEATNKDIILQFPELSYLKLENLKNLKGVCAYKFEDRLCFNVQVAFPALEKLSIDELPNITKIWDKNLLQPESFCLLRSSGVRGYEKLRSLKVWNCKKLMNVVPSHMLPLLKNIEILQVCNCPEMEVIVVLEKRDEETREAANNDTIILFPELTHLFLQGLEKLKGVCAYKFEDRLCFNVQVVFSKLIIRDYLLDKHTKKIVAEATSRKQECATTDASSSGMQLQP